MEIDIANNIKAVELLKVELLRGITDLFGDISAEADGETEIRLAGDAADIIAMTHLLCRRLGIDNSLVSALMCKKLEAEIEEGHILERRFGDLSSLLREIRGENFCDEKYEG